MLDTGITSTKKEMNEKEEPQKNIIWVETLLIVQEIENKIEE